MSPQKQQPGWIDRIHVIYKNFNLKVGTAWKETDS